MKTTQVWYLLIGNRRRRDAWVEEQVTGWTSSSSCRVHVLMRRRLHVRWWRLHMGWGRLHVRWWRLYVGWWRLHV